MNKQIAFSILIFTYNRAHFISEAIESVLPQMHDLDEFIIVDDGSTDNTGEVVNRYLKLPNFYYERKNHTKAPDTRNRALQLARNPYVIWLGSDDMLFPDVLETYRRILNGQPQLDVVYGNLKAFGDTGNHSEKEFNYRDYYNKNSMLLNSLFYRNAIPDPGTLVKRSVYKRFGNYDLRFERAQDYEFWIRIAKGVTFKHCKKTVLKWRWHGGNLSAPSVKRDSKFSVMALNQLLNTYRLDEIFASFNWKNREHAMALCYLEVLKRAVKLKDQDIIDLYLSKLLSCKPNMDSSMKLLLFISGLDTDSKMMLLSKFPESFVKQAVNWVKKKKGRSFQEKLKLAILQKKNLQYQDAIQRFLVLVNDLAERRTFKHILFQSYLNLGEIFEDLNDKNCFLYYRKALEILQGTQVKTKNTKYQLASLYQKTNQMKQAAQLFHQLLQEENNPSFEMGIYFHLGEIAILEENFDQAIGHLKKCLSIDHSHKKAKDYLVQYSNKV